MDRGGGGEEFEDYHEDGFGDGECDFKGGWLRWGGVIGLELGEVWGRREAELVSGVSVFHFHTQMHGGNTPPATPQQQIRRRKGREGRKGVRGLARGGTRWPSGARSSQPGQTVQVGAGVLARGGAGIAKTQRRKDAEEEREADYSGTSLRLCASAVEFGLVAEGAR